MRHLQALTMSKHALPSSRGFFHELASRNKAPILPPNHIRNYSNYVSLLSSCKTLNSLLQIHARLTVSGLQNDHLTNAHLIKSYLLFLKCNFARFLFDSLPNPSVMLYNSIIRAYSRTKNHQEAINIYHCMLNKGLEPDKYTFTFVLKACTGALFFKEGILVHKDIIVRGLERDAFIGTSLVDMYCKMGDLKLARNVFDKMPEKDVVAWSAMILGLSQSEDPNEVFGFIRSMQLSGVELYLVSILNLVPAVSRLCDIDACRCIHGYVIRRGFDAIVSNGLIDMYSKSGNIDVGRQIFEYMPDKDDVSWGTMMAGYAHSGCFLEVLELFDRGRGENVRMNKVSVTSALTAAAEMRALGRGTEIHDFARQQGIDSDVAVATPIMTMYARCGEVDTAKQLFQGIKGRDLVAWSAIIAAFVQSGYPQEALSLFRSMQNEGLQANKVILLSSLPACAEVSSLKLGKSIHCCAVKANVDLDISVGTALVSMYAKCGFFALALTLFNRMPCKDVVTWNAMINGYAQIGEQFSALEMFHKLQLSELHPNSGTMVGLLPAFALLNDLDQGSCIHGKIIKCGFESECHVNTALIDMYAKCGSLSRAEFLFHRTGCRKDEVSWNVMIAGYMHSGHAKDAFSAFFQMKLENIQPNIVTIVTVLPAVAHLSALRAGMALHAYVIRMGFQSKTPVGNCLIDMYAKCGWLDHSEQIFHEMKNKDTVSWNVMLAGYAVHGRGSCAIELFSRMQDSEIRIDSFSFINVLSACRHACLIEEGRKIFDSMSKQHQLEPDLEHYACMADLLGRAGLFDEVLDLIKSMPMEPDAGVWGALLGASMMHSNVQLAEFALDHLDKLEPKNLTHYAALSNTYARSGRWADVGNTRLKITKTGLRKSPGYSWV
ncbi:pentatricopeptide repeat-containing protein [Populus alba x Populus x berolinensis]|nr:pentatricopeptide repeat-containing protein [Populus alba x Populus x berolinensis]